MIPATIHMHIDQITAQIIYMIYLLLNLYQWYLLLLQILYHDDEKVFHILQKSLNKQYWLLKYLWTTELDGRLKNQNSLIHAYILNEKI